MKYFDNQIYFCSNNYEFRDIKAGTKFHFKKYGDIVHAKFLGRNIISGELIGMVKLGELEAIFNYYNTNSQSYSGSCTLKLAEHQKNRIILNGRWVLSGDFSKGDKLVLEASF